MVAHAALPRRTGMQARFVIANVRGEEHYILRVSAPEGEYDVDLTADCWGEAPVRLACRSFPAS